MIDLNDLRARPKEYEKAAKEKGVKVSISDFLKLDEKRRKALKDVEDMRAKKNTVSKSIPTMKGKGKEDTLSEMKALSENLKKEEEKLKQTEETWVRMQLSLPQIPLDSTPKGKDESGNTEIETYGDLPTFDFEPRDHITLGEALDIIDIPRGVKVAGSRSYFLKGDGVRLQLAVMRYALDEMTKKGWTLFSPPLLAHSECLLGTGFLPDALEQTYAVGGMKEMNGAIESDNLNLIGTSEVSVASYHKDEVLEGSDLPKKYCGYSACFRREAGTYGKDTKGLYRVHQFEKVEQVVLCTADQKEGLQMFEEIERNAKEILESLQLPYRILNVCTGDMGKGKVVMHDIETWMPSRNAYGETHSCSYLGDFQARRLNMTYKDASGEKRYVHTLNNTLIASPRILIPILEIYQNADGSITIPEVVRPYMNGQKKIG